MSKHVTDIDRGFKAMRSRYRRWMRGPNVTVGIQGTEASTSRGPGFNQASLAAVHEFGSADGTIPQRSFIRGTVDREKSLINKMLTDAGKKSTLDGDLRTRLGVVGSRVVSEMVRTIDQSIDIKPNKPATAARKGSSTPLIHLGTLKGAITFKVHA